MGRTIIDRLNNAIGPKLTVVTLRPLTSDAISGLVCRTLHINTEEAAPLVAALARHSHGVPFTVKNLLFLLKSENYVGIAFFCLSCLIIYTLNVAGLQF
jgi:predicted ATPase